MPSPEIIKHSGEHSPETQHAAAERSSELLKGLENRPEQSPEKQGERIEDARHEAHEILSADKDEQGEADNTSPASAIRRITQQERVASYKQTMKHIQSEMSTTSRSFSKFIHNRGIEKTSEAVGATLARPDAIFAGSLSALVLVAALYVIAHTFGYRLSGFETIGAFILGWVIGVVYDYVRLLAVGRRS